MSDQIIKIIPANPFAKIPNSVLLQGKDYIQEHVICDSVDIKTSECSIFVDCGSNLQCITCPKCGKVISFEWWGDAMGRANECSFQTLDVALPCCGETTSLNDLIYDFKCGFALCLIEILNPF